MARIRNQKLSPQIIKRWTATSSLTSHLTGCPPISSLFYSVIFLTSGDLCEMDGMIGWAVVDETMLIACFPRLKTLWMLNHTHSVVNRLEGSALTLTSWRLFLYNLLPLSVDIACDFLLTSRTCKGGENHSHDYNSIMWYVLCLVCGLALVLLLA